MRTRLQLALMAIPTIAISFCLTSSSAQAAGLPGSETGNGAIIVAQEEGRVVYVNDAIPRKPKRSSAPQESDYTYWSVREHRWKPVYRTNRVEMRAARSAADEVREMMTPDSEPTLTPVASSSFMTPVQIDTAIEKAAERHNVDPNLVRAVVKVESNFNPRAVSRKGAMGLMQLMPFTARQLKVTNPFDPQQNVDAGVRHLKQLLDNFGGDVKLTLAAYNAGTNAVLRSSGMPPYAETRNYVKRITQLYWGTDGKGNQFIGGASHDPVRVYRDADGVLPMTNTD